MRSQRSSNQSESRCMPSCGSKRQSAWTPGAPPNGNQSHSSSVVSMVVRLVPPRPSAPPVSVRKRERREQTAPQNREQRAH